MNANRDPSPTTPPPAVSVILPAYNVEEYIDEAIQSILAQTFTDFELIVVDDGSTDRTLEIVRGYATNRALKIIANGENLGLTKSLNIGIAAARGGLIARQDGDDISLPTRLAEQVAYMEANPEIAVLGTARLRLSADGEIDRQSGRLLSTRPVATATDGKSARPAFNDLLQANHFVHGSVMMRKSVLDEVGGYDEFFRYTQDYELWLRIAKHHATANLLEPLYALRSHAASVTKENTAAAVLFQYLAVNTAQEQVSDAAIADIKQHGIARYYEHLTGANKIAYHKSLANTYYRNKQWLNALFQYRELKQLGGANLKARLRLWLLNFRSGGAVATRFAYYSDFRSRL